MTFLSNFRGHCCFPLERSLPSNSQRSCSDFDMNFKNREPHPLAKGVLTIAEPACCFLMVAKLNSSSSAELDLAWGEWKMIFDSSKTSWYSLLATKTSLPTTFAFRPVASMTGLVSIPYPYQRSYSLSWYPSRLEALIAFGSKLSVVAFDEKSTAYSLLKAWTYLRCTAKTQHTL